MSLSTSCIVADPPEYRAPVRTRPVLNVYGAAPPTTQALIVSHDNSPVGTKFSVAVRSEDGGEALRAIFFLDYGIHDIVPGEDKLVSKTIPASTYDNTGRSAEYTWFPPSPMVLKGCHFLTLVVAHQSSFLESDEDHLDSRLAADDAAMVTWTVNVNPNDERVLDNCPSKVPATAVQ